MRLERTFRDGHSEQWWALEAERGPYGPEKGRRLVVATTDPEALPERTTRYLRTNLPAPVSSRAELSELAPAEVAEILRLYRLRMWVEQSYQQFKQSLGWAHCQVRKNFSIRRHWQLVCCAFSFCWWSYRHLPGRPHRLRQTSRPNGRRTIYQPIRRSGGRAPSWPVTLRRVRVWLQPRAMLWRYCKAFSNKPPPPELRALLERAFSGRGLYLYVR